MNLINRSKLCIMHNNKKVKLINSPEPQNLFTNFVLDDSIFIKTSSSQVPGFTIENNRYEIESLTKNHGITTPSMLEQLEMLKGKTLVVTADVLTENTTVYIKLKKPTGWTFCKLDNISKKIDQILVTDDMIDFKVSIENNSETSNTCIVENLKLYIKNDIVINSKNDIPNRNFAIWSWKSSEVLNPNATLEFLKLHRIKKIYQQISSSYTFDQLKVFVGLLRQNDIEVNLLDGNPSWVLDEYRDSLFSKINSVVDYNSNATEYERINAIQLDIEPHTLDNWDTEKDYLIEKMQETTIAAYNECKKHNIKLIMCLAYWYDGTTYNNIYGAGSLYDFIANNSDEVAIMCYNPKNYLSYATHELSYGMQNNHRVAIGFETKAPGSSGVTEDITYFNRPVTQFYTDWETVYFAHKLYKTTHLHEFAIHDYTAFKEYIQ